MSLTKYDCDTIQRFYVDYGYTQEELSDMYGVSRTTIRRVLAGEYEYLTKFEEYQRLRYDNGHAPGLWPKDYDEHTQGEGWWPKVTRNFSPVANVIGLLVGWAASQAALWAAIGAGALAAITGLMLWRAFN